MDTSSVVLAIDLGASSGRLVAGEFNSQNLKFEDIHRFPIRNVEVGCKHYSCNVKSIGVDSWGVDYGLLDRRGKLLGHSYQYRDRRTDGMQEFAASHLGEEEIFAPTGVQPMFFNALCQLSSEVEQGGGGALSGRSDRFYRGRTGHYKRIGGYQNFYAKRYVIMERIRGTSSFCH